jgi:hypothetical protein
MATIWIEEEADVPLAPRGNVVPVHNASIGNTVQQKITIGGSTTQSSAFAANTKYITVHSDAECYFDIGSNPTATTSTRHLAAGIYRTYKVKPTWKIAAKDTT